MPDKNGAKKTPTKRKGKAKPKDVLTDPVRNDGKAELEFFVDVAKVVLPKEKDEWRLNEMATILLDQAKLIRKHWLTMNTIAERSEDRTLAFSMGASSTRKSAPPDVKVGISFSESWRDSIKSKVPDPNQAVMSLPPGESTSGEDPTSTTGEASVDPNDGTDD